MTERELIEALRRLGRETLVDMFEDWYASNAGWGTRASSSKAPQDGQTPSCDCPICRATHAAPAEALYQLARLHAEGVGHLMRAGAGAFRHFANLGLGVPCHRHGGAFDAGPGCGSGRAEAWPGRAEVPARSRGSHRTPPDERDADFYWAGRRDETPPRFQFFVQNQNPQAICHVDVCAGSARMQGGYRPNVEYEVRVANTNLKPWEQTLVEVVFSVQHCASGCLAIPFEVCLDGERRATHWAKLLIKE